MKKSKLKKVAVGLLLAALLLWGAAGAFAQVFTPPVQVPLAGRAIPKYVDPLPHFAGVRIPVIGALTVSTEEFQQMVLPASVYAAVPAPAPGQPNFQLGTYVWGYKVTGPTGTFGPHYPGFTLEPTRGVPATITYVNNLGSPFLQQYLLIDQTLHWADPLNGGVNMGAHSVTPGMAPSPPWNFPYGWNAATGAFVGDPAPIVTHLHGGEVESSFDGGPEQWFTSNDLKGVSYRSLVAGQTNAATYFYPNAQEPATLWFHDHMLGGTRLNVYAGLAAFYLLRDWTVERQDLPGGPLDTTVKDPMNPASIPFKPEIEIAIQDRMFDTNGQLFFPNIGINIEHPFWIPEFVGDTILVNGKSWPYLNVEPRRYRFRMLDGSNARFYELAIETKNGGAGPRIWQIGTDGGLLNTPVPFTAGNRMLMAPGERHDVIVDFSGYAGQTLTMTNTARAPYPRGATVDPQTTGKIMQFRVGLALSNPIGPTGDPSYDPATLASPRNPANPFVPISAAAPLVKRQLTLNEIIGAGGPLEVLLNNTKFDGTLPGTGVPGAPIASAIKQDAAGNWLTELPKNGSTEVWEIINLTADAHPIHLHLVQFNLIDRQDFQTNKYLKAYTALFPGGIMMGGEGPPQPYTTPNADGAVGGNPAVTPFLQKAPTLPLPEEVGWKDTVIMYPGQVTRIAVRFATQAGTPFPFDPTVGPGYVWHCHIIDHEDNEMMRPYQVQP